MSNKEDIIELKPVYIEWVDTIGDPQNNWKDKNDTDEFFDRDDNIVKEVGFIWNEDDNYINLISKYMPSDDIFITLTSGRTKIPKKWILIRVDLFITPNKII